MNVNEIMELLPHRYPFLLVDRVTEIVPGERIVAYKNISINESDLSKIKTGMQVKHGRFGEGKVIAISGDGSNKKATVFFTGIGQKELLLKFAKLELKN